MLNWGIFYCYGVIFIMLLALEVYCDKNPFRPFIVIAKLVKAVSKKVCKLIKKIIYKAGRKKK